MTDTNRFTAEAADYVNQLIGELSSQYDMLYSQDIDLEDLGNAIDALSFVDGKLRSHLEKLVTHRKKLLSNITTHPEDIKDA